MISGDKLYSIYESALRIRLAEERIAARYPEQQMRCPTHLSIGQEAVAAAVGFALRKDDYAISTHRGHAHYLGKGGDLGAMIAEIYGKSTGCSSGKGGSMHLIDVSVGFMGTTAIVGNSIPVGVGFALAAQMQKTDQVACVFVGDGSIEEGVFYEAANFAALKKLPVLFVCENNLYSVYSHLSARQPEGRKIHNMVAGMGLRTEDGDGNKASEIYNITTAALERIRAGSGPELIEFYTYRWREHCGPNYDNDIGYRTEAEFEQWKMLDPILDMQASLKEGTYTDQDLEELKTKIESEIDLAFNAAIAAPYPDPAYAYQGEYR